MRRYLRCPGAICCPARRALRACCSHIWFCDELIADALSPLPRECGASAYQLAAADAPCAASRADAFGCDTVAHVLFPEAAAPASASPASRFALAVIGIDHGRRLKAQTGRSERVWSRQGARQRRAQGP